MVVSSGGKKEEAEGMQKTWRSGELVLLMGDARKLLINVGKDGNRVTNGW